MIAEPNRKYAGTPRRLQHVALVLSVALSVVGVRLWQLQVVNGGQYRGMSESNRLRIQRLEAPRGSIYGRMGPDEEVVLADNRAARDLMVVPADITIADEILCQRIAEIAGIDAAGLAGRIAKARKAREPHQQILVRDDVSASVSARVDEYAYALPGVFTVVRPLRRYVYGKSAGQLLGYLGEINKVELDRSGDRYRMGDLIGRSGVESRFQERLHGRDGHMLVTKFAVGTPQIRTDPFGNPYIENLVDSYGHSLALEEKQESVPGEPVYLALDIGLQAHCERLLEAEHGAIVVLDADSGETLALASSPGYDPNVFVSPNTSRERVDILQGTPNRMLNRAYQDVYAPGSVFKVLLAAAALEEHVIDTSTTHYCPGYFRLEPGGRPWHCWRRQGHGNVNVIDAIAFSCDVFFYNVGLELGVDRINKWSDKLGVGVKTGLDLPGEVAGLIPSRAWKEDLFKPKFPDAPWEYRWYPGDTVNLSIGQGAATTTPLQNAVLMAAIVNGGYRVQPRIQRGGELRRSERMLSDSTVEIVQRGMRKCVEKGPPAPTGTGNAAHIAGWDIIGKTGSAQMVSLEHHEQYENEEDIPKDLRDHAWFIAGVLDRKPRLAICILVEHGHHGSSAAAPLARNIFEYMGETWYDEPVRLAQREEAAR